MVTNSIFADYDTDYNEVMLSSLLRMSSYELLDDHDAADCRQYDGLSLIESIIAEVNVPLAADLADPAYENSNGLALVTSGGGVFAQGPNDIFVKAGEMLLWTGQRPVVARLNAPTKCIVLVARKHLLAQIFTAPVAIIKKQTMKTGIGSFTKSHVENFSNTIDQMAPRDRKAVIRITLDLLSSHFSPEEGIKVKTDYHKKQLARIKTYIGENLLDRTFSPQSVAEACGFSKRSLHKIFEGSDTTFSEWVRNERLGYAAEALSSEEFRTTSITEIAYRFGFCDAPHFSRCFKQRYGAAPHEFRERARSDAKAGADTSDTRDFVRFTS